MASVTFAISPEIRKRISFFEWVNWSELARQELAKQEKEKETIARLKKIISKSKFNEKDANEISNKIKLSMHDRLKKEGKI
jgi:hypothetical protein